MPWEKLIPYPLKKTVNNSSSIKQSPGSHPQNPFLTHWWPNTVDYQSNFEQISLKSWLVTSTFKFAWQLYINSTTTNLMIPAPLAVASSLTLARGHLINKTSIKKTVVLKLKCAQAILYELATTAWPSSPNNFRTNGFVMQGSLSHALLSEWNIEKQNQYLLGIISQQLRLKPKCDSQVTNVRIDEEPMGREDTILSSWLYRPHKYYMFLQMFCFDVYWSWPSNMPFTGFRFELKCNMWTTCWKPRVGVVYMHSNFMIYPHHCLRWLHPLQSQFHLVGYPFNYYKHSWG